MNIKVSICCCLCDISLSQKKNGTVKEYIFRTHQKNNKQKPRKTSKSY